MKIYPTNEILGSLLSTSLVGSSDATELKNNPQEYIYSKTSFDLKDKDLSVIENSDKEVSICLPYYEVLDAANAAEISEEELADIAGGEVFVTILVMGAVAGGVAAGATAIGLGVHYGVVDKHDK